MQDSYDTFPANKFLPRKFRRRFRKFAKHPARTIKEPRGLIYLPPRKTR